ncbi:MAG: molybdate ABC transporter substrate-binding protein [Dehalococcoidia bacterium]
MALVTRAGGADAISDRFMRHLAGLVLLAALSLSACGSEEEQPTLLVSAASSLTEAMTEIAGAFEAERGQVTVELNFGASSALATQIVEGGAPVDVFASANAAQMQRLSDSGDVGESRAFAHNALVLVVPASSSRDSFEAIAESGVRLVLAAPDVPIGAYAREVIAAAGASGQFESGFADAVLGNVVSEEANVRQVLTKVELGEADAGIVYATDAIVSGDLVRTIPVPAEFAPLAVYPIATIAESPEPEVARLFVDFVLSSEGQAILQRHGFTSP